MPEYCDSAELEGLRAKLLWRGPASGDERFLSVFMDQNNKCNLRCQMCGFSDSRVSALPKYDLPRWAYDKIAAELFPHARYVCLSLMTEPFMTRDFPERLAAVRRYGVPFGEVITNGTLLTPAAIERVLASGLSRVIVSIDGGTKEVFEQVRAGANFGQVTANFAELRKRRDQRGLRLPKLRINHVLSELNIDHFDSFLRLAESLGTDEVAVRTVSRMSNAIIQENTDLQFWALVRAARVQLTHFCKRTGIEDSAFLRDRHDRIELLTEAGGTMMCRVPWTTIAIHPNGDVYPCMAWSRPPIGNLGRQTFDEIWKGEPITRLRAEFETLHPGVDCLHCTIRRAPADTDDDFFYRKLAATPL